jgi:hypothetical protein
MTMINNKNTREGNDHDQEGKEGEHAQKKATTMINNIRENNDYNQD